MVAPKHNWGFEGLNGSSLVHPTPDGQRMVVRDLWLQDEARWDRDKVVEYYGEELGGRICELPIISDGPKDRMVWFHASNGLYSTKSTYSWHILRRIGYGPHRFYWRQV